jgi:hypothetical protein
MQESSDDAADEKGATLPPGTQLRSSTGTRQRPTAADSANFQDRTLQRETTPAVTPARGDAIVAGVVVQRRFVLEQVIGTGSMGQVWKAKDLIREQARNARSYVAIKLLNADCAQHPDAFVGLEREASKAQDLAHPNIITVHNFDFDRELQRAFISMEYLEGDSLEKTVQRFRGVGLTRREALPIIDGLSEGLGYAHKKRVVHCDLKPGNVFVTSQGTPKILDFGIARAARLDVATAAPDEEGFQGYTPAYASPQLILQNDPLPADDIYSFGVVLYELLSGRHPFGGLSADVAQSRALKPAPLKGLKAREWQAIEKALAFDRSQRWVDATAFRRAFQGRSLVPRVLAAAVVALLAVAGVLGFISWRAAQPDVPFEQLPRAAQQSFLQEIQEGNRAWELVSTGQTFLINDALAHYGAAFDIHPKDHRAVVGLSRAADFAIDKIEVGPDPATGLRELRDLQERNAYLGTYQPLRLAIDRLQSRQGSPNPVSGER